MSNLLSTEQFLQEFVPAVVDDDAAVFAGAGLSRSAGFVDWKQLLKTFAEELGLDLDIETDFPAVAQYHLNREDRVRSRLNQKLTDELSRAAKPSDAHANLALLPISTYWTSNYDHLIEDALKDADRQPVVRQPRRSLTTTRRGAKTEVLKMHGDIDEPDHVVITSDDYERYAKDNAPLLIRLRNDLIAKSFLFIGFSFADPNLQLIFGQLRQVVGDSPRTHYAVLKKPHRSEYSKAARYRYELNRWRLRVEDLQRFGIKAVVVSDYDDIPELLRQIRIRSQRRRVLVSGSFAVSETWPEERLTEFCHALGRRIITEGYDLASGFGMGVGSPLITGAVEELYRGEVTSLERRLLLRPFPQTKPRGTTLEALWDRYRRDLIAPAGFAIFVAGNKLDPASGEVIPADGVRAEFEIARELGAFPLPVGASGSVAGELWKEVRGDFETFFPPGTPKRSYAVLGSAKASDAQILDALFTLIRLLAISPVTS
jgi:hypothetical protein